MPLKDIWATLDLGYPQWHYQVQSYQYVHHCIQQHHQGITKATGHLFGVTFVSFSRESTRSLNGTSQVHTSFAARHGAYDMVEQDITCPYPFLFQYL